jgi:hypothetical protein
MKVQINIKAGQGLMPGACTVRWECVKECPYPPFRMPCDAGSVPAQ